MEIGKPYDVADHKIKIKSYDEDSKKIEYNLIVSIIRKEDDEACQVMLLDGTKLFRCSSHHRIYSPSKKEYVFAGEIDTSDALLSNNEVATIKVVRTGEFSPIVDLRVKKTHNYFTNGVLSHNTGGNALKFYASVRADVRRGDVAKGAEENTISSIKAKVKIVKNKMAPPFKQCELTFGWGTGISIHDELVELAVKYDIIEKAGSWYSYNDERLGQGTVNIINMLKENQAMFDDIEKKIYGVMNLPYKQREVIAAVVQDEKPVRKTRAPKEEKEPEV